MFVALRELRAARGRFALISTVVVLVAVLVTFLSGLTAGLRHQSVSVVESIDAEKLVFAQSDDGASFDESVLTSEQVSTWLRSGAGVTPIGISRGKAGLDDGSGTAVALVGADAGVGDRAPLTPGTVILSRGAAEAVRADVGDALTVGSQRYTVGAVRGDDWYSHTPVLWMTLSDWNTVDPRAGAATVLAVDHARDPATVDTAAGTVAMDKNQSLTAIGSFTSENGSLTLMTVLLFAISALVIGAFFTVWTVQRTPDIATLKALGATSASLVRDAMGQALLVLLTGVAAGVAVTAIVGSAIGDAVPFVLTPSTTVLPAAAMVGLGLLGAGVALRFLFTTDPLTALGSTR